MAEILARVTEKIRLHERDPRYAPEGSFRPPSSPGGARELRGQLERMTQLLATHQALLEDPRALARFQKRMAQPGRRRPGMNPPKEEAPELSPEEKKKRQRLVDALDNLTRFETSETELPSQPRPTSRLEKVEERLHLARTLRTETSILERVQERSPAPPSRAPSAGPPALESRLPSPSSPGKNPRLERILARIQSRRAQEGRPIETPELSPPEEKARPRGPAALDLSSASPEDLEDLIQRGTRIHASEKDRVLAYLASLALELPGSAQRF